MIFPLFSIENNKLISMKGDESYFYSLVPTDMEQVNELSLYQQQINEDIKRINEMTFLKVYKKQDAIFVNSKICDYSFSQTRLIETDSPLDVLFEGGLYSEVDFKDDYFVYNGSYGRLLSLKDLPEELNPLFFYEFEEFIVQFHRVPNQVAKRKLDMKRRISFASLFKGMRDISSETSYKEVEDLIEDIIKGEESLVEVEVFFIVRASNTDELAQKTKSIIKQLKEKSVEIRIESNALQYFFANIMPGVAPTFKRSLSMPSRCLADLLPFHRDFIMEEGIVLKSQRGKDIFFNLFFNKAINYNLLITGGSGQGKSVIANKIMYENIQQGRKGLILDLGGSFRKLTKYHGGIEFKNSINPMRFGDPVFLKEFIVSCIDKPLGQKEEGRLLKAIRNKKDCDCFYKLMDELEVDFEGISDYFEEFRGFIGNKKDQLSHLTYTDLANYPSKFQAPLIVYLLRMFRELSGEKIFLFDECWHLLERNASYIAECFRTFRKHKASAIAISQNLEDFLTTPLGRVIVQNTYFKVLFRQSIRPSEFVSERCSNLVEGVYSQKGEYSEFVLTFDDVEKIVRYNCSPLEYELFTSDKDDNYLIDNYMEEKGRFIPYPQAMNNFTNIKYGGYECEL